MPASTRQSAGKALTLTGFYLFGLYFRKRGPRDQAVNCSLTVCHAGMGLA